MLYNSLKEKNPENEINSFNSANQSVYEKDKSYIVSITSVVIIISGVLCFFLKGNWTNDFYLIPKIFVFFYIGISLCFLINFGMLDFLNFFFSLSQNENFPSFVETKDQTFTLLILSFIMGIYYGFMYSIIKIETGDSSLTNQINWNHNLTFPFGVLSGISWILINEVLMMNSGTYKFISNNEEDPFNEEI